MKRPLGLIPLLVALAANAAASPPSEGVATYTDAQAGYAIDYPAQAILASGLDAALGFNTVFISFPPGPNADGEFAGVIITVFDNPDRTTIDVFARERFGLRRDAPGTVRSEWIGGTPALLAHRPSPLAGEHAAVALIEGDGVIIRIGLFGGGIDGPIEPPAQHYDWFNQIVHSIRRAPRKEPPAQAAIVDPNAEPPAATTFQVPFNVPVTTLYGEQYGVAISNTAYGVRNLGLEHRRTCFGVDWPRLLHSGVDWFRSDGQYQTPTDVLAVADGEIAWYDPNYNTYPGKVVIVRHRLADGRDLYSMYAHLGPDVSVVQDQLVFRGQRIGSLLGQGSNTHLHFELRYFLDGRSIYGAYTACNSTTLYAGRGYTYRVHPDNFPAPGAGYLDPIAFIQANDGAPAPSSTESVSVITSTLRIAGTQPAMAYKDGTPMLVERLVSPP
ncbi:MAG TPA: M23 family metallopeptidase, partial [Anaerolineae bacterium]